MDESIKFAWAYLLHYGKLTTGKWKYYSSSWETEGEEIWNWEQLQKEKNNFIEKILAVGIDWNKTKIPTVSTEHGFNGTFESDSEKCLGTLGTLVLKNGKRFLIGSSDDDAAYLVETAKKLIEGKSEIMDLARKL